LSGADDSTKAHRLSGLFASFSPSLSVPVFSVDPIEAAMWRGGLAAALNYLR
jgi:hypothetical protein